MEWAGEEQAEPKKHGRAGSSKTKTNTSKAGGGKSRRGKGKRSGA
jgi:hypothetical protein